MNKKVIYVAFDAEDIKVFSSLTSPDNVILTCNETVDKKDYISSNIINVCDFSYDSNIYVNATRELFECLLTDSGIDLKGYANNFFECTLSNVLHYSTALESMIEDYDEVVFSERLIFSSMPNYYLGEHESQGRLLYKRKLAFQNTLVDFLAYCNIEVKYLNKSLSNQCFFNKIRDVAVFSIRFIKAINNRAEQQPNITKKTTDRVILLRSISQFQAIKLLLEESNEPISIYCSTTFTGGKLIPQLTPWAQQLDHINLYDLNSPKLKTIFFTYFNTMMKYFKLKQYKFRVGKIVIDVTQSLREILIMSAETNLYLQQLELSIPAISQQESCIISCEQKSPHAYIESIFAKKTNYKFIQVMSCDQNSNDLPYPIQGDKFVVDTLQRKKLFLSNWSRDTDKLAYIGPIKSVGETLNWSDYEADYTVCYFAHVNEINHNKKVIEILNQLTETIKAFSYCVKLHPRDDGRWADIDNLKVGPVFSSKQISNDKLFKMFEVGISNPSAIVMDLLCQMKPFIFIDIIESYKNIDFVSCDEIYPGYITSFDEIGPILIDYEKLYVEVESLSIRVFGDKYDLPSLDRLVEL